MNYEGIREKIIWLLTMFPWSRQHKRVLASADLLTALNLFLLPCSTTLEEIQRWYQDEMLWDRFVKEVLSGKNAEAVTLNFIMAFLVISIDKIKKSEESTKLLLDAFWDEDYENPPRILNVIAHVTEITRLRSTHHDLDSNHYLGFMKHIAEELADDDEESQYEALVRLQNRANWVRETLHEAYMKKGGELDMEDYDQLFPNF